MNRISRRSLLKVARALGVPLGLVLNSPAVKAAILSGSFYPVDYFTLLKSYNPTGLWKLDDAVGSTTFADSSGNGNTLTISGTPLLNQMPMFPAGAAGGSVNFNGSGMGVAASSAFLDMTTPRAYSAVMDVTPQSTPLGFIYSKSNTAGTAGHWMLINGGIEIGLAGTGGARKWSFPLPPRGQSHVAISFDGNIANTPKAWVSGVAQTVSLIAGGSPTNLTNTGSFILGGRGDGLQFGSNVQAFEFFDGVALNSDDVSKFWSSHQNPDRSKAKNGIYDTDGGSTDRGDLIGHAVFQYLHQIGVINARGVQVTCGDAITAPTSRAMLDGKGLQSVPVGAYQLSNITQGGAVGSPSYVTTNQFRPGDTRANYVDPVTFYTLVLTPCASGSVWVAAGGFLNSISQFLNSSAAAVALWNDRVAGLIIAAGQWPNSSAAASPPGNYNPTGPGSYNISAGGPSAGPLETQAAIDICAKSTVPHYWCGDEICGGTATDPAIPVNISSSIPVWGNSNPIYYGCVNSTAGGIGRTAWDQLVTFLMGECARLGAANSQLVTLNQIATPTFSTSSSTPGQNSSVAGSSNNYYLTPNLNGKTLVQWYALIANILNNQVWAT